MTCCGEYRPTALGCQAGPSKSRDVSRSEAAAIITEAVVGLGVSAYHAVTQFGYENGFIVGQHVVTFVPTVMAGVAASMLSTFALFELFQTVPMHRLVVMPAGRSTYSAPVVVANSRRLAAARDTSTAPPPLVTESSAPEARTRQGLPSRKRIIASTSLTISWR